MKISEKLIQLRRSKGISQEELAEKLDVSRQTLSKWETGESVPDIDKCMSISQIFGVSLDDLVNYESSETGLGVPPKGKHAFGIVTVGDKGQIVIPAKARKIFNINSGEIERALRESVSMIVHSAKNVLEKTPPELSADIIDRGVIITGGGALLHGMDQLLVEELKVPVFIAENPMDCVAIGTGIMLDNIDRVPARL